MGVRSWRELLAVAGCAVAVAHIFRWGRCCGAEPPAPRPSHRREVAARLVISPKTELYILHRRAHR